MRSPAALVVASLVLTARTAEGGEAYSFVEKFHGLDVVAEVELTFDKPIPKKWPNKTYKRTGWAFPDALIARACKHAKVTRVFKGKLDGKLGPHCGPGLRDIPTWWWDAHAAGKVKLVVYLKRHDDGTYEDVHGVEGSTGSLDADYDSLTDALAQAGKWTDDTDPAALRKLLASKNRYLVYLAAAALCQRGEPLTAAGAKPAKDQPACSDLAGSPGTFDDNVRDLRSL